MSPELLLLVAVFTPFVAALLAPAVGGALKARAGLLLSFAFAPGIALVMLAAAALAGHPVQVVIPWVPQVGLEFAFHADGFSLLFALIVSSIGFLVMLYASAYLGPTERHGRFYSYLLLFGGAMLGLVLADNLVILFAFWELTSISSFLLIGFWDSRKASQDGAVKAFLITALGGFALLAAMVLLMIGGGSARLSELDLVAFQQSPYFVPAALLLLTAAFTKSAQLPFHLWLPTAMEAPTPVSAYLHSATMVKAGVFLVATFGALFAGTNLATFILYVGLLTMFWGSYLALRQNDLKALLAYSTVSQLGIMMALYGAGYSLAATAQLINHAAFKAALFLVVGIIDHETGSRDIGKLSGLWRKLPLTFVLAVPAALSMAGLPPWGGFISKELFYEAMLREGLLPLLITITGSIMTFAYSLRFLKVFFGPYRAERGEIDGASWRLWGPIVPLTVVVVLFGVPWQDTVASWFTTLAAPSFGYQPVALHLWHGLGLGLALSVLTWFFGLALHLMRDRFDALQERLEPGWNVNTIYYALLGGLERGAGVLLRHSQGASFATHLRLIWLPVALVGTLLGWRYLPTELSPVPLEFILVALLTLAGIVGVLVARTRLTALIWMGLSGFASTFVFVLLRAPDLALTQLLIETVTVILFLSVFRYLPPLTRYRRPPAKTIWDALIALGVGGTLFAALLAVQNPIDERLKDFFLSVSKELGGGYNVVNVILVDIRGYDTMGEITVLAIVATTVYALLKLKTASRPELTNDEVQEERKEQGLEVGN